MKFVSDREIRNQPGKIREELLQGDLVLTSRGRPYALMLAVDPERLGDMLQLAARLRAQAALSEVRRQGARGRAVRGVRGRHRG